MNVNDMTLGQVKELMSMFGANSQTSAPVATSASSGISFAIGKHVIIRTYSAGVWFGVLSEKSGNEVILSEARRMYRWWAAESVSLSAVALHGIKRDKSKICEAVNNVWLEAIEILPCTDTAIESIKGAENVKAQ